ADCAHPASCARESDQAWVPGWRPALPVRLVLRVPISGVGGDQMADPPQRSTRPDPEPGRDDEPEDPSPEGAIVDLTDAGDQQAEHGGQSSVSHCSLL